MVNDVFSFFVLQELQHVSSLQFFQAVSADDAFLAYVLTEKHIYDNTYNWDECQHHKPCHCFGRLSVVHKHGYHRCNDYDCIYEYYYPVYIYHICVSSYNVVA